ncbi:MAG: ABC transporter ATP-binding protein [Gloeomargaritaceae cyanobacterium C42_A2020_066]|nr:ABC transporter ATP-binding protein [Gloeomargaritaceae cyanobacterium C42_A2020_066]
MEAATIGLLGPFIALAASPKLINRQETIASIYEYLKERTFIQSEAKFVALIGLIVIIIHTSRTLLSLLIQQKTHDFAIRLQRDLQLRLLRAYLHAPYSIHLRKNSAQIIHTISGETSTFSQGVILASLNYSVSVTMFFFLGALVIATDPLACLVIVVMLLFVGVIFYLLRHKAPLWGKTLSRTNKEIIRTIQHAIGGIKETKVMGCEIYFENKFQEYAQRAMIIQRERHDFSRIPKAFIEILTIVSVVGLICIILFISEGNQFLIAKLGIIGLVAMRLSGSSNKLSTELTLLRSSNYVIDSLYNELRSSSETRELEKGTEKYAVRGGSFSPGVAKKKIAFLERIDLCNVSYRYPRSDKDAIQNVSLKIYKGESIAFIGRSGAGKTTLVDIILGLLKPSSGDIVVDGVTSIYEAPKAWRQMIGYIPQSIFLMDDTFVRNIAFGVPDRLIDIDKVNHVIDVAQLRDVVNQLPNGIETRIGERGTRLSGGQRQRVGIARAMYHDSEILVLDEATAALDQETEKSVVKAIKNLGLTKTLITIAHRLETIKDCDRVYVLDQGRIIRMGTYDQVVLRGEEKELEISE